MSKLVPLSGKELCKLLQKLGFILVKGKGSHVRLKHPDGRRTVVPIHANETIGVGLLSAILKQVKLDKETYERMRLEL